MKRATLEILGPLLEILRAHRSLEEVRPATFQLDGRPFLHFHEEADGVFADVLLAKGRVHVRVSSRAEQADLVERIDPILESAERRHRSRRRGGRGGD